MHEDFQKGIVYNDIALLILNRPVLLAKNVATICLPSQDQRIISSDCVASGWGKDVFGEYYIASVNIALK